MGEDAFIQSKEDAALMVKAQKGDRNAYVRLHERYVRLVRDYLAHHNGRPESSEDLLQEVFTRVWEHRGQYQPGTPLPAYLLGFARNVVREHKARTRYERLSAPRQMTRLADGLMMNQTPPPSRMESAEQIREIRALVRRLPAKQRQAVELVYFSGFEPHAAARQLNCSKNALKARLSSARQTLRRLIQEE